ncbi:unnamed protein product [Rhizophagus irregularis]|nr:unnamed protein product [Rhizophagus irregularis]
MSSNNIIKDEEIFLKEFLKDFYRKIIRIDHHSRFENILIDWIQDYFNDNNKNSEMILKLMENHKESENWFSSLIGFFYEHDISINDNNTNINNKNDFIKFYLLSIKNYENKKLTCIYQLLNLIISKYLLSIYYYKDIIFDKRNLISKSFESANVMSLNQFEYLNGLLEINLRKDELSTIEKYFESLNNDSNKINYIKRKELEKLNDLGTEKDEKKAFEWNQ